MCNLNSSEGKRILSPTSVCNLHVTMQFLKKANEIPGTQRTWKSQVWNKNGFTAAPCLDTSSVHLQSFNPITHVFMKEDLARFIALFITQVWSLIALMFQRSDFQKSLGSWVKLDKYLCDFRLDFYPKLISRSSEIGLELDLFNQSCPFINPPLQVNFC